MNQSSKVNLTAYLQKKAELNKAEQSVPRKQYCFSCMRPTKNCLCRDINSFKPRINVVILIHPMEAKKEKLGTGRLSHLFLENSKLIQGINFTQNQEVNELIENENNACYLLYPGENAVNLSIESDEVKKSVLAKDYQSQKNIYVFVIDGTWPCAKKMMKESKNLHSLKRISFNVEKKSIFAIKEQPGDFCLSTIESIHLMLGLLEKNSLELPMIHRDLMLTVFQKMIDYQIQCAADPSLPSFKRSKRPYKNTEERTRSKKWETRKIIF